MASCNFGAIRLLRGTLPGSGLAVYMIDAPALYDRPGNPYADADGDTAGGSVDTKA